MSDAPRVSDADLPSVEFLVAFLKSYGLHHCDVGSEHQATINEAAERLEALAARNLALEDEVERLREKADE